MEKVIFHIWLISCTVSKIRNCKNGFHTNIKCFINQAFICFWIIAKMNRNWSIFINWSHNVLIDLFCDCRNKWCSKFWQANQTIIKCCKCSCLIFCFFMNPESFTDAAGNIQSIASVKGEEQVCILEIPVGASIAGTKITEKFIQIGLNSSSYANLTDDALSIVRNACFYLMGMNSGLPSKTDTFESASTGMRIYLSSDILNVSFDCDGYDKTNI